MRLLCETLFASESNLKGLNHCQFVSYFVHSSGISLSLATASRPTSKGTLMYMIGKPAITRLNHRKTRLCVPFCPGFVTERTVAKIKGGRNQLTRLPRKYNQWTLSLQLPVDSTMKSGRYAYYLAKCLSEAFLSFFSTTTES